MALLEVNGISSRWHKQAVRCTPLKRIATPLEIIMHQQNIG